MCKFIQRSVALCKWGKLQASQRWQFKVQQSKVSVLLRQKDQAKAGMFFPKIKILHRWILAEFYTWILFLELGWLDFLNIFKSNTQRRNAILPLSGGVGVAKLTFNGRNPTRSRCIKALRSVYLFWSLSNQCRLCGLPKFVWKFHKNFVSPVSSSTLDSGWSLDLHSQIQIKKEWETSFSLLVFKSFRFILQ